MDIPDGVDPKMLERTMKRSSIILMLEDIKMMMWQGLAEGKFDGKSMHDIVKIALDMHQQEYLKLMEAYQQKQAGKKIPDGTKEN